MIVTGCLGARDGGGFVREQHPQVLAVTGPHATHEVMAAVHAHLPRPHDPFVDLVPPQGIILLIGVPERKVAHRSASYFC